MCQDAGLLLPSTSHIQPPYGHTGAKAHWNTQKGRVTARPEWAANATFDARARQERKGSHNRRHGLLERAANATTDARACMAAAGSRSKACKQTPA
jgi:hypothetical protein